MTENLLVNRINELVQSHYEYLKSEEQDASRREALIAESKVIIGILKSEREMRSRYFEQFFKERQRLLSSAQNTLDFAIKIGDAEIASVSLEVIKTINGKKVF